MNFPRYKEYKNSNVEWVGDVPVHWDVVRLKNLLQCRITDGPHTTPIFEDSGVPFLSVDGIQDGELQFNGCRYISEKDHAEYRRKALPQMGDLLMGKAASTGKIARVKVNFEFSIWSPLALIRLNPEIANPIFYEYSLKSPILQAQIDSFCTANTQKNISMDDIPRLVLTLPPLAEQSTIAAFLDIETAKIDELVKDQERLIALLKEKRQAVISRAVTKGINANVPMKNSGIKWLGDIPKHWKVLNLKRVWSVIDCKHITAEFSDDGIPLASIGEVQTWFVDLKGAKKTTQFFYSQLIEGGRKPESGDLIFSRNATVGEVAQVNDQHQNFAMGQDVCLLRRLNLDSLPDFFQFSLKSTITSIQLAEVMVGATFKRVNVEDIRNLLIVVPPYEEQKIVCEYLHQRIAEYENLISEATHAVALLLERRDALISTFITGKADVHSFLDKANREAA